LVLPDSGVYYPVCISQSRFSLPGRPALVTSFSRSDLQSKSGHPRPTPDFFPASFAGGPISSTARAADWLPRRICYFAENLFLRSQELTNCEGLSNISSSRLARQRGRACGLSFLLPPFIQLTHRSRKSFANEPDGAALPSFRAQNIAEAKRSEFPRATKSLPKKKKNQKNAQFFFFISSLSVCPRKRPQGGPSDVLCA